MPIRMLEKINASTYIVYTVCQYMQAQEEFRRKSQISQDKTVLCHTFKSLDSDPEDPITFPTQVYFSICRTRTRWLIVDGVQRRDPDQEGGPWPCVLPYFENV